MRARKYAVRGIRMASKKNPFKNPLFGAYETVSAKGTRGRTTTEEGIVQEVLRRYQVGRAASTDWRREARRAYNYYENAQRPPEIDEYDDVLYVTLNLVRSRVDTKVGILTQPKPRADVQGRGLEDADVAAAFKDLLEYSADEDRFDTIVQDSIADMCKCGLGVLEEELDPDAEQLTRHGWVRGKLGVVPGNPLDYTIDPKNRTRSFWNRKHGPDWYFTETDEIVAELMMLYPSKARRLESLDKATDPETYPTVPTVNDDYEGVDEEGADDSDGEAKDSTQYRADSTVKVLTHWFIKPKQVELVFEKDKEGRLIPAVDPDTNETLTGDDLKRMDKELRGQYEVVHKIEREVWTCGIAKDILLWMYKSPYKHNRWPAVFFSSTMHRGKPMPFGEIHNLFDAQDLYNKLNSVILDNAIRTNNAGWVLEEGAMDPDEEQRLEDEGSEPGFVAKTRMGRADGLRRLEPGQLPHGLWEIQRDVRVTFDELSSLYQTQRGGMPYETSGKAIMALQEAGDTALVQLQRSVEDAITDWGRKRLSNIQQFYTFEKQWRISDKMKEQTHYLITQLQKKTDPVTGQQMNEEDATLHMYKLEDDNPEPTLLTEDFTAPMFDLKFIMGTGHLRSRDQKVKEAEMLFDRGAVDEEYLAREFEVEGYSEIRRRMDERNPVIQLGTQVQQMMEDPNIGGLVSMIVEDPGTLVQILEQSGIDPQNPQAVPAAPPPGLTPPLPGGNGVPPGPGIPV